MGTLPTLFLSLSPALAIGLGLGSGDHVQIPDTGTMGGTQHLPECCHLPQAGHSPGTLPPSPTPRRAKGIGQVAGREELCSRTTGPLDITLSKVLGRQTQFLLPNASPRGTPESL